MRFRPSMGIPSSPWTLSLSGLRMKWKSRIRKIGIEVVEISLALFCLAMLEYEDFIRKRNERR